MPFPFYKQPNSMDCGPTCLRMIARYHGKSLSLTSIKQKAGFNKEGVSLLGLSSAAESFGFHTRGVQISYLQLKNAPTPCILHWDNVHFVVLVRVTSKSVKVADPATGMISYNCEEFLEHWLSNPNDGKESLGTALLIEPTVNFSIDQEDKSGKISFLSLKKYLLPVKWRLFQVIVWLLIAATLQLLFPYLTQSMVDTGIGSRDISFIMMLLIAQVTLALSLTVAGYIRSRLQLKISSVVNMSMLSDFWYKITRLPLTYFDTSHTGDTLQRISDSRILQSFLTGPAVTSIFSIITFITYSVALSVYNLTLFIVFAGGSICYFLWIKAFMGVRRKVNYQTFRAYSQEAGSTIQLVHGMQEIRLNNAQQTKRWEWENIQARIVKLSFRSFDFNQWQSFGAQFINQGKDILITFLVAKLVIDGKMSLGAMIAVQYIIGQLSGPVHEIVIFAQTFQDAKISLERLNEIHILDDEEPINSALIHELPPSLTIRLVGITFSYPGQEHTPILNNINLTIPEGKVTAIVGPSGSGKTTLLKLLLRIFEDYRGNIFVSDTNIRSISPSFWRNECGSVLQDGYIFNDTIARNIAVNDETFDIQRLFKCCELAELLPFIRDLPKGFNTHLGVSGIGVSQGQKQRLLIARALYKEPKYLFLDEATNALDTITEKSISQNLGQYFKNKTVVIVAHRLSTVLNADNIIVLDNGMVAEQGNHEHLMSRHGKYYDLVKDQLT